MTKTFIAKAKNRQFHFLADLLDDLTHEELTALLNWLAINKLQCSRAEIKGWREVNKTDSKN